MNPEVVLYCVVVCVIPFYPSYPFNSHQGQRDILGTRMYCTCVNRILGCGGCCPSG